MEFCRTYGIPYESYVAAAEHGKLREFLQNHFLYLSFLAKQKEKGVDVHGMSKDFVMELLSNNPDVIKPAALAAADDKPVFDASKAMPWLYPPQKEKTPEEVEQEREAELKKFCTENDVNLEDYKNAEKNGNLLQFLMSSLSGFAEVAVATEVARTDATAREQYNATGFGVKPKYDNIRF